jgi:hypothetical protein
MEREQAIAEIVETLNKVVPKKEGDNPNITTLIDRVEMALRTFVPYLRFDIKVTHVV